MDFGYKIIVLQHDNNYSTNVLCDIINKFGLNWHEYILY